MSKSNVCVSKEFMQLRNFEINDFMPKGTVIVDTKPYGMYTTEPIDFLLEIGNEIIPPGFEDKIIPVFVHNKEGKFDYSEFCFEGLLVKEV